MESGSLDLRSLVDGLSADELDELRDAVASRLCREKYGADTIEGLLAKWGHEPACPSCGGKAARLDGHTPSRKVPLPVPRMRREVQRPHGHGLRCGQAPAAQGHEDRRGDVHNASLRLVELTCPTSSSPGAPAT